MIYLNEFFIFESTIGSEEISKKWYPKIKKKLFFEIINIDPTTIRKKEFSKPGKYSKWLLMRMIDSSTGELTESGKYFLEEERSNLNLMLYIFSTGWYKLKQKGERDILKFKSINEFMNSMSVYEKEFMKQNQAEFDFIYSDDEFDIMVPLNFSASFETAKNTDWCTKNCLSWEVWSKKALLFRIIPKSSKYSKVKLTWEINEPHRWTLATEKYPELRGLGNPFEKEIWSHELKNKQDISPESFSHFSSLRKTLTALNTTAKDKIVGHFNIYKS